MNTFLKYYITLDELVPQFRFRLGHNFMGTNKLHLDRISPCLQQCYQLLDKTGRSFAIIINVLDGELRNAVCTFYLALRAMDTIEDDMTIPIDTKMSILNSFDKLILDRTWKYTESKDDDAIVLENFPIISQALHELPRKYKDIILETIPRVAKGMALFVGRDIVTMKDLNQYAVIATSLFVVGLSRLFIASGLEDEMTAQEEATILELSLLLHKANYIRDVMKDVNCGRLYWTKDIWSKYASRPEDLLKPENRHKSVECLNELITDALGHVSQCLSFTNNMKTNGTRQLLDINKVMAVASLERCYNNPEVFTKSVKIRRGEFVKIFIYSSSKQETMKLIQQYITKILKRTNQNNTNDDRIRQACLQILNHSEMLQTLNTGGLMSKMMYFLCTCSIASAVAAYFIWWFVKL